MKKKINPAITKFMLIAFLDRGRNGLEKAFDLLPGDANGVEVTLEDMERAYEVLANTAMEKFGEVFGFDVTPEAPPAEPEPDEGSPSEPLPEEQFPEIPGWIQVEKVFNTGKKISVDGMLQDRFVFSKDGPEYTKGEILVVWSDGNKLHARNSEHMTLIGHPDRRKYVPGYPYFSNPAHPTAEAYAKYHTHPEWCALYRRA